MQESGDKDQKERVARKSQKGWVEGKIGKEGVGPGKERVRL